MGRELFGGGGLEAAQYAIQYSYFYLFSTSSFFILCFSSQKFVQHAYKNTDIHPDDNTFLFNLKNQIYINTSPTRDLRVCSVLLQIFYCPF